MYESPIEITVSNIVTDIEKRQEEQIFRAVQNVGINVDRAELIKALEYDRGQYKKGYVDGIKDFFARLRANAILDKNMGEFVYTGDIYKVLREITEVQDDGKSN